MSNGSQSFGVDEDPPEPALKRQKSQPTTSSSVSTPTTSNTSNVPNFETSQQVTQTSPSKPPRGKSLDLSEEALLEWLKARMQNKTSLVVRPNLLAGEDLQYSLQSRGDAMNESAKRLKKIFESSTTGVRSRVKYAMPVCSAMSGIGKSRMLDEWVMKFNNNDYMMSCVDFPPAPRRLALVMSYANGHSVTAYERSMGSQAGFAWRLLHAVFLDANTDLGWEDFWSDLPDNAKDLTLRLALRVLRRVLQGRVPQDAVATGGNRNEFYALFVGIDEYQLVPMNDENQHPLAPLLEALVNEMANQPPVVMLPMFAGTDWSKMSSAASGSSNELSASASTTRLSMSLLDPEEMRKAVLGRGGGVEELLIQEIFCRHLFFLGGVPRPCTQYAEDCHEWYQEHKDAQVGEAQKKYEEIFLKTFRKFFDGVYMKAPRERSLERTDFTLRELICLVAYSVRGGGY